MRIKHAFSLVAASANEIYCGDENGVFYVNTQKDEIEQIDIGNSNLLLFKDIKGNIFASNKSGFYLIKNKRLQPAKTIFPALAKLDADHLSCAIQYNDSLIFFGSVIQKGLSVWNTRSGEVKTFHNDSAHSIKNLRIIDNLYKDNAGNAFIITEQSIISFNPLTEKPVTFSVGSTKEGQLSNLMDMCETTDGYAVATYGDGIIVTDKKFNVKKSISTAAGLSNSCVYKIFSFKNYLIATTNNGLNIIDLKDFTIQTYYKSDGLHSSFFEQVCGIQYRGKIYAGGVNGFTVIDPDAQLMWSQPEGL